MSERANHIFWTGGWDSTFRLLDLLLLKKRRVQPFYVVNLIRPSFPRELQAMRTIRDMIFGRSPEARGLLLPLEIRERGDIRDDAEISGRFARLSAVTPMGQQYEYLARFAAELGLHDLELSIRAGVHKFLRTSVVRETDGDDSYYRLREELAGHDMALFSRFHFPVLDLDKPAMEGLAARHGFADIMERTWFCYTPDRKGRPCGRCNPCLQVLRSGMGRRISPFNKARGVLERKLARLRSIPLRSGGKEWRLL